MALRVMSGFGSRAERDALVQRDRDLRREARSAPDRAGSIGPELIKLRQAYFQQLPAVPLGRCPFCDQVLLRKFDPWGLDGLWWRPLRHGRWEEPESCEHFRLLRGAVDVRNVTPQASDDPAKLGPDVPYVIPRLLELQGMVAVLGRMEIAAGMWAYPITYFSPVAPPPGSLAESWTSNQYDYQDADGQWRWSLTTDPWDFDLGPWIAAGKLRWTPPGDPGGELEPLNQPCPLVRLSGHRQQQELGSNGLACFDPPSGEDLDPFAE